MSPIHTKLSSIQPSATGSTLHTRNNGLVSDITGSRLHTRSLSTYFGTSIGTEGALLANLFGGNGNGSWLNTKLPNNTAVAPGSSAAVEFMAANMNDSPYLNMNSYTATINVAPTVTPLVPVTLLGISANSGYAQSLKKVLANGVPIPTGLRPTNDTDAELCVYHPATDTYWELWRANGPETSTTGGWTCEWGGRMSNASQRLNGHSIDTFPTGYDPVIVPSTYEDHNWLAQATSIPLSHTTITHADFTRPRPDDPSFIGYINHPIGLVYWEAERHGGTQGEQVWPAQRRDASSATVCPQGARFRLPYNWVINTSKPHHTQMIERCLMEYGAVLTDTGGGGIIRCEPGSELYLIDARSTIVGNVAWSSCVQLAVGNDTTFNITA